MFNIEEKIQINLLNKKVLNIFTKGPKVYKLIYFAKFFLLILSKHFSCNFEFQYPSKFKFWNVSLKTYLPCNDFFQENFSEHLFWYLEFRLLWIIIKLWTFKLNLKKLLKYSEKTYLVYISLKHLALTFAIKFIFSCAEYI